MVSVTIVIRLLYPVVVITPVVLTGKYLVAPEVDNLTLITIAVSPVYMNVPEATPEALVYVAATIADMSDALYIATRAPVDVPLPTIGLLSESTTVTDTVTDGALTVIVPPPVAVQLP